MVLFVVYKRYKQAGGAEETLPAHSFLAVLRPGKIDHQGYLLWYQCHCWRMEYKCCSPPGLCSKFYTRLQPWSIYMASSPWQYRMVDTLHLCTFLYKYCINYQQIRLTSTGTDNSDSVCRDYSDVVDTDNPQIIGWKVSQVKYRLLFILIFFHFNKIQTLFVLYRNDGSSIIL